ncbi:hypothetical protein [Nitrospirillum iridis]|uniref:ABC-type antimicrobial peptide transport system ATPase subunit n=1 Tax=Nitrospirillum iridis TaxID=765888 RepID=A0A7X0EG02_9PROT|nr:hypothetical protein [Nitrospirillum iridis]MBB6254490.1 ABC-type antimicrobial peptide transport system ATPase subunit [Nitrospirillum iridis]
MATLVKVTQDGRRLEVVGLALRLDGALEAVELVEVARHPHRLAILRAVPDATHMAGRVALTAAEAAAALAALQEAEADLLASPQAIHERFRIAALWKAREQGIE